MNGKVIRKKNSIHKQSSCALNSSFASSAYKRKRAKINRILCNIIFFLKLQNNSKQNGADDVDDANQANII